MDLVGPFAQTAESPLEKWFRDAKIYQLFEGTAEIQRLVISRMQAAEYRERLQGATEAIASEASANGRGSASSHAEPRSGSTASADEPAAAIS
jgi:hypothetical protein